MSKQPYILLTIIWLVGVIWINPIVEFPLNDDWVYAYPVYFLRTGKPFHFIDIQSMTLFSQVIWGWLFTLPLGFSFVALRLSTLVAAWLGILATYKIINHTFSNTTIAFWAALTLAVNPLYFSLAFTFMTDVPFTTWSLFAFLFFFQFFRQERWYFLAFATLFSIIAVLNRQSGLFMPLAFSLAYGWLHLTFRPTSFSNLLKQFGIAVLPLLLTLGSLVAFNYWIDAFQIRPNFLRGTEHARWEMLLTHTHIRGGGAILYLGLFLLPFSVIHFMHQWRNIAGIKKWTVIGLALFFALFFFKDNYASFPVGNIIYNLGIGPLTTFDALLLNINNYNNIVSNNWIWGIRLLMLLGGTLLLFHFFSNLLTLSNWQNRSTAKKIQLCALCAIAVYLPLLVISETYFDRYFVSILIPAIMGSLPTEPSNFNYWHKIGIGIFTVLIALFSLLGTRDYVEWNKLRWQAAQTLEANGIDRKSIDGGYEYNGWYFGDISIEKGEWFWTWGNEYLITFGNVDGYKVINTYTYQRYLPYKKEKVFVLKKE
jgi:hypothetical protein